MVNIDFDLYSLHLLHLFSLELCSLIYKTFFCLIIDGGTLFVYFGVLCDLLTLEDDVYSIGVNLIEAHFDDLLDYIGVFLDVMKMLHNHGVLVVFVSK